MSAVTTLKLPDATHLAALVLNQHKLVEAETEELAKLKEQLLGVAETGQTIPVPGLGKVTLKAGSKESTSVKLTINEALFTNLDPKLKKKLIEQGVVYTETSTRKAGKPQVACVLNV